MYTTVNNWICKRFIKHLFSHKFYACINLFYNVFKELSYSVSCRMLCYFFSELKEVYGIEIEHAPICVLQEHELFKNQPLLLFNFLAMRERYHDYITLNKLIKNETDK